MFRTIRPRILVDTFDDGLECVEIRSLRRVLRPTLPDHVVQFDAASFFVVGVVEERRPEVWSLAVLHQLVDL